MHPETVALIVWAGIVAAAVVWRFRQNDRRIRDAINPASTLRPAVLYDQDAEPTDLELAQVVAEATDIARQAAT